MFQVAIPQGDLQRIAHSLKQGTIFFPGLFCSCCSMDLVTLGLKFGILTSYWLWLRLPLHCTVSLVPFVNSADEVSVKIQHRKLSLIDDFIRPVFMGGSAVEV